LPRYLQHFGAWSRALGALSGPIFFHQWLGFTAS
jgi:hypothetical protein